MAPLLLLLLTLGTHDSVVGQTPTGSIDGVVVDASGAVVPGVTVVVTHEATGVAREAVSDA